MPRRRSPNDRPSAEPRSIRTSSAPAARKRVARSSATSPRARPSNRVSSPASSAGSGCRIRTAARPTESLSHTRTEVDLAEVRAYIGLGANVGDARQTLTDAVGELASLAATRVVGVSTLYRTAPVGVTDQPDFLNAVVALDVPAGATHAAGATGLLVQLKGLEREFGRRRRGRWGPRELDLDLLLFGRARLSIERPA